MQLVTKRQSTGTLSTWLTDLAEQKT